MRFPRLAGRFAVPPSTAAVVQGGDVRSGAERHDKLVARPLWNLATPVAELETRACTGYALLPARRRAKSRREPSLLQPRRGRGLWGGALAGERGGGW